MFITGWGFHKLKKRKKKIKKKNVYNFIGIKMSGYSFMSFTTGGDGKRSVLLGFLQPRIFVRESYEGQEF